MPRLTRRSLDGHECEPPFFCSWPSPARSAAPNSCPSAENLSFGDSYLVGVVNRLTGDAKYVRVFYDSAAQRPGAPPLGYVRVGAHRATLVGATPSSLAASGVPETTTVAERRLGVRTFGVNCRRESIEAFLEVRFVGDELRGVGATQFAPGECDFAVGWREERVFSLPASS